MKMKVGLFFGSFNPIHFGHLMIASYMVEYTDLDALWFVVSPQNPHKSKNSLANDYDRLHLVQLAIHNDDRLKVSDIEFGLTKPSYTVDTLAYLSERYPDYDFVLIIGGDNLETFHKWKNYEVILNKHELYVYKRPNHSPGILNNHPKIKVVDAPQVEISSSFIRDALKNRKSIKYLLPDKVAGEVMKMAFYTSPN